MKYLSLTVVDASFKWRQHLSFCDCLISISIMSSLWIKDFLCCHMLKCFLLFQDRLTLHYVCTTFFFIFSSMGCFHLHFWGKCCTEHGSGELMLSALIVSPKECEDTMGGDRYAADCSDSTMSINKRSPIAHIRVLYLQLYFIKAV